MRPVIIGTAGHVDHGKSTLIRALTGIDPDRLKEEKERGMTIDLGFAHLSFETTELTGGGGDGIDGITGLKRPNCPTRNPESEIGIVDVPGHERFLKNMLAGATGVDLALLVIDSEEGVMPQTREHAAIMQMLGVQHVVVALTKVDRTDGEWVELVEGQVREFLEGRGWEEAPIVRVSAITGHGLNELRSTLYQVAEQLTGKPLNQPFRLPIDRVFVRPGFGTVVTGTLIAGHVQVGDMLEVLPQGLTARVRGLQTHSRSVEHAIAGQRVAVNLTGLDKTELERGNVLAKPGACRATTRFNAHLSLLASPITHGERAENLLASHQMRVRIHLGTAEAIGRLYLMQPEPIRLGESGFVQIRLESPLVCTEGDRFILRRYSPLTTLGGGVVLESIATRYRRHDPALLKSLQERLNGSPETHLLNRLKGFSVGVSEQAFLQQNPEPGKERLEELIQRGCIVRLAVGASHLLLHPDCVQALTEKLLQVLSEYHRTNPLKAGMPPEALRTTLGWERLLLDAMLKQLSSAEGAQIELFTHKALREPRVRQAGFEIKMNPRQQSLYDRVEKIYLESGILVPVPQEVSEEIGAPPNAITEMLRTGVEQERFALVGENLYYPLETLQEIRKVVQDYIEAEGSMTAAQFRDLTQSSRKYAVPLLEYFDAIGFTKRVGDARVLVKGSTS
jgi:selenocysteine-specific elongation factor